MSAAGPRGRADTSHADVVLCPGGPLLLRGDHVVEDADGVRHATTRPVSAVCRCGHTATSPWCDGTHKVVRGR
ncbi:MAG: CDGSH iron-sulfur domain-containing protein [Marmoricola sp.]